MRKPFFATITTVGTHLLLFTTAVAPARAEVATYCVNCSTLTYDIEHQLWEAAQWIRSIENQIMQIEYEIRFWTSLVQNTISLPARIFNDITGEIARIQGIAREAEMMASQTKWMIQNLSSGYYGSGSLDDIPRALQQENAALALAMQKMASVTSEYQSLSKTYSSKLESLEGQHPEGITQAVQVGNAINATIGQQNAAQATAMTTAFQALATAEVRRADRESLLDEKAAKNQREGIAAACAQLSTISPPVCRQQPSAPPTGTGSVTLASSSP